MMKAIELGKPTKEKTIIFDMDETMISARFESKLPRNFEPSFDFNF